ncbi:hypothetical protein Acsp04_54030 [Actinomadura sp. NBRC 104425]|uniref:terpene synthase family protein n=1 Tax=Actinomadura sp. NBRC 104425 TaxID=3032204 RepID=UPI0024A5BD79|nr:hypothetical protein [Actinomadura sp. NBRC 104425]GLZ15168.1 hypothetical protein Acsp04_54030 [Actinomadura sp. NBRC 104425]
MEETAADHRSAQGTVGRDLLDCQADLDQARERYRDLFPSPPFSRKVTFGVAAAVTAQAPGCTTEQLRPSARTSLWIFGLDYIVDTLATEADQVHDAVQRCRSVADGGRPAPGDTLAEFLADLRDELAAAPAYGMLQPRWRKALDRMLTAMVREWHWKTSERPTLDQYLDNADNFGSTWVNITHWIATCDERILACLDELEEASQRVQQVLRLYNDLATQERDRTWGENGDLNALALVDGDEGAVQRTIDDLLADCRRLLEPLRDRCPHAAAYLHRQIEFSRNFYVRRRDDYWDRM